MDMWSSFFETAMASIPFAADKIVFDRYHLVQHMNHAVDQVRRAELRISLDVNTPFAMT
jgi:transposase